MPRPARIAARDRQMGKIIDAAKVKKNGWAEYKWWNVVTKKIAPKQTYFERAGDYIFASGLSKISK